MPFPQVNQTVVPTASPTQGVRVIITVSPLPTLNDKVVSLDVDFAAGVAGGQHGYFSKLVPAAATSTQFLLTVPLPAGVDPASIVASDIIQNLVASYFFVGADPTPLNG